MAISSSAASNATSRLDDAVRRPEPGVCSGYFEKNRVAMHQTKITF